MAGFFYLKLSLMFGLIKSKKAKSLQCSVDEETGVMLLNVSKNLTSDDFEFLAKIIAEYFEKKGPFAGIIVNAKKFPYWKGAQNREEYVHFVANNHHKFDKVALTINGVFVRILPKIARGKIRPQVRRFSYNEIERADQWILDEN